MKTLTYALMLLALITHAASANPLYQWTGSDGTPTFSPDPPPKGVDYTIVGADLKPLTGQAVSPTPAIVADQAVPAAPSTASKPTPSTIAGNTPKLAGSVVLTPPPQTGAQVAKKAVSKWKPVKYADDPNPDSGKPTFSTRTAASTSPAASINRVSDECLSLKEKQLILESQFAGAQTPRDMDKAVLLLNSFQKQNKGRCGY